MSKMDRLSEVEEKHLAEMNKLSKTEFSEKYGYKNLSNDDFAKRKAELNDNIKRQVEDTTEARDTASSIYRGGDADVLDGIAYTIFKHIRCNTCRMKNSSTCYFSCIIIITPRQIYI